MKKWTKIELASKYNLSIKQIHSQANVTASEELLNRLNTPSNSPKDNALPSKITDEYWVYAESKKLPKHEWYALAEGGIVSNRFLEMLKHKNSGKWLIFIDVKELDETWEKVRRATEKGILGDHSKVSTAKPNPHSISDDEGVICVYTNDWKDFEDVTRIKKALRSIGIKTTLYYKTNGDTDKDKYKVKGAKNISKYISKSTDETKEFDLTSLNGVNERKVGLLKNIGIENYDDLLSYDTSQELKRVGITTQYIEKLKLYALSQKEDTIYKLGNYSIPKGEIVYFDIETDLSSSYKDKRIWSIAVYHRKKVKSFVAQTFEEEKEILKDFIAFIKKIDSPILFCYSGQEMDRKVITIALERYNLSKDTFLSCKHYDLCSIIKENYVFPVKSFGLKSIASYLGYKFKNPDFDGLYAASQYLALQEEKQQIPKELTQYITDDVKSMNYIFQQLKTIKNIEISKKCNFI